MTELFTPPGTDASSSTGSSQRTLSTGASSVGVCECFWDRNPETDALAVEQLPLPCAHNNWDAMRVKRGAVTLQCRDCGAWWKLQAPIAILCPDFKATWKCALGVSCPYLHVHRFKDPALSPDPPTHRCREERDPLLHRAALDVLSVLSAQQGQKVRPSLSLEAIGCKREELLRSGRPFDTPVPHSMSIDGNRSINASSLGESFSHDISIDTAMTGTTATSRGDSTLLDDSISFDGMARRRHYSWNPYGIHVTATNPGSSKRKASKETCKAALDTAGRPDPEQFPKQNRILVTIEERPATRSSS